ncbi:MAG TPA: hypothetical protein VFC85_09630 [Verrucomicrobiae bacterium]|nr:hypothetical protein [Verrucomicrobiae bacterium]
MNENENFEALRRLLALKRHEIPPPGYFNNFSDRVMAQIRAGKAAKQSFSESWLKFLQIFEMKPAFTGAFASALLMLLVAGMIYSNQNDVATQPLLPMAESTSPVLATGSTTALAQPSEQTLLASSISNNSTSSLQPVASLFGQQNPLAQQVSFSLSGN